MAAPPFTVCSPVPDPVAYAAMPVGRRRALVETSFDVVVSRGLGRPSSRRDVVEERRACGMPIADGLA